MDALAGAADVEDVRAQVIDRCVLKAADESLLRVLPNSRLEHEGDQAITSAQTPD
jgi:hypothetical protein